MVACARGNFDCVELLLNRGANANALDVNNSSPLHKACEANAVNIVVALLDHGADIEQKAKNGLNALLISSQYLNHIKIARILLKRGANAKVSDSNGKTALHFCAVNDDEITLERLLRRKADIDAKDSLGRAPIHYAAACNSLCAVEMLINFNANVDLKDNNGQVPLMLATDRKVKELLQLCMHFLFTCSYLASDAKSFRPSQPIKSGGEQYQLSRTSCMWTI